MTLPPNNDKKWKILAMGVRALLIQALGLWEDFWDLERTIEPRKKRKANNPHGRSPERD